MALEIDHAFIACRTGAPEADVLLRQGFVEGSPNTHPGQGTANRRFFFVNFMLELIWVVDHAEVTSAQTRRTRLWERCSNPESGDSPFGIVFRSDGNQSPLPFQSWSYFPSYLPEGTAIEVAEGTTLQEPALFYLPFLRARKFVAEPTEHRLPFHLVRAIAVGVRSAAEISEAAISIQRISQLRYFTSDSPLLELLFKDCNEAYVDLRPTLPLILRGEI